MNFKRLLIVVIILTIWHTGFPAEVTKETRIFDQSRGQELKMDIYSIGSTFDSPQSCIIFMFGGGFKSGTRDAKQYTDFFNHFAHKGYKVISIDYRLGMVNEKPPAVHRTKPLQNALSIAVEDLFLATRYIIDNAHELNVDIDKIVISGSSAGAMTVLQAEYEKQNGEKSASILPSDFSYAGVMAFSGVIFSNKGTPKYKKQPAPTLMFHGTADKLVVYNKTQFLNKGVFGSGALAKQYKKKKNPYELYSIEDLGHEVCEYPMVDHLVEIEHFLQHFVLEQKQWMHNHSIKDMNRKLNPRFNPSKKKLYADGF